MATTNYYRVYWSLAFVGPHVSSGVTFTITRASETTKTVSVTPELRFGFDYEHEGDSTSAINISHTGGIPLKVKQSTDTSWTEVSGDQNWERTTDNAVPLIDASNGKIYKVYQGSYGSTITNYRTVTLGTTTHDWTSGALQISFSTQNERVVRSIDITIPNSYMPAYKERCKITYTTESIDASEIYSKATAIAGNPATFSVDPAPTVGSSIKLPTATWNFYRDSFILTVKDGEEIISTKRGNIEIKPQQDKWTYENTSYNPGSSFTVPNAASCELTATYKTLTPIYTNNKYTIDPFKFSKAPKRDESIKQIINFNTGVEEIINPISVKRYKEYTYTFNGFTSNKNKTINRDTPSYTFESDETLTVQWQQSSESSWQPIELPYLMRDGYTFMGWRINGEGDDFKGIIRRGEPLGDGAPEITLEAHWEENVITDFSNIVIGTPGGVTLDSKIDLQTLNLNVLSNNVFKNLQSIIPNALYFIKRQTFCKDIDDIDIPTGLYWCDFNSEKQIHTDGNSPSLTLNGYLLHFITGSDSQGQPSNGCIQFYFPLNTSDEAVSNDIILMRIYNQNKTSGWQVINNHSSTADYVIETGTAPATLKGVDSNNQPTLDISNLGPWCYRKWASGIAECWAQVTLPADTQIKQQWPKTPKEGEGILFESYRKYVTFPELFFTTIPVCTLTPGNGATLLEVGADLTKDRSADFWLVRPDLDNSINRDYFINIYAIGKWTEDNNT